MRFPGPGSSRRRGFRKYQRRADKPVEHVEHVGRESEAHPAFSIIPTLDLEHYHLPAIRLSVPKLIMAVMDTENESVHMQLQDLMTTAGALAGISTYAYDDDQDQKHAFGMTFEQKVAFRTLDITRPSSVVLDNFDTLLNVFRVAVQNIGTHSEQISQLRSLLEPDQHDDLGMSQLEQCARAPFGFWALTRKIVPVTCGGESVSIAGQGFGSNFLKALKYEKVLTPIEPNTRHGGCPALYPAFRGSNQINRFGKLFIDWHEKLHAN